MLDICKRVAVFAAAVLLSGCSSGDGVLEVPEASEIVFREKLDIYSLADAERHGVNIQIAYSPDAPYIELLACIPRPAYAPPEAVGEFIFGFYRGETMLFSKSLDSAVKEAQFETVFLYLNVDYLSKLRIYFEYPETNNFKAVGSLVKSYDIRFERMADELIKSEIALSYSRELLQPPPLPSCVEPRDK